MLYIVKIDRKSIRKNLNAGYQGPYFTFGSIRDRLQTYYTFGRQPKYFFDYIYPEITCLYCSHTFPSNELEDEVIYEYDGADYHASNICPKCKQEDCCEIERENIEDVVRKK